MTEAGGRGGRGRSKQGQGGPARCGPWLAQEGCAIQMLCRSPGSCPASGQLCPISLRLVSPGPLSRTLRFLRVMLGWHLGVTHHSSSPHSWTVASLCPDGWRNVDHKRSFGPGGQ